jgi:hypothetical protein
VSTSELPILFKTLAWFFHALKLFFIFIFCCFLFFFKNGNFEENPKLGYDIFNDIIDKS